MHKCCEFEWVRVRRVFALVELNLGLTSVVVGTFLLVDTILKVRGFSQLVG